MMKRLATYCIIGIFIVTILLQLNTYLSLIPTTPSTQTPSLPISQHERYQRDYTTLVTYITTLVVLSFLLLFKHWIDQYKYKKNKLLGLSPSFKRSSWQRWVRYEWRLFSTSTWSLLQLLQVSALVGLNALFLFKDSNTPEETVIEGRNMYLQMLANRSAQLALTNVAMSVMLSAKLSIIQRHFFPVQSTLEWHACFGRLGLYQVLYHATYQLQFNYTRQSGDLYTTFFLNVRYATGTLLLSAMIGLVLGSHPMVRTYLSYRLFRWTHLLSFTTLILFGCLHHWAFYVFYATVLVFWVTDQLDRSYETESCTAEALPGNIVRLTCQVPYTPQPLIPGQFAFISFGSTSWFKAWVHSHPFSICKMITEQGDEGDKQHHFVFYIKANGRDTDRLYNMEGREIKARISRPLGRPYITNAGSEFGDYESIVLIAEGVGITPWISVLNYIEEKQHAIKTKSVDLIWSIHSIETYYAFEKELEKQCSEIDINIQVFITGATTEAIESDKVQFNFMQRPAYKQKLSHIQQERKDIVMGICAHEETTIKATNIGLFYSWDIKTERFEL